MSQYLDNVLNNSKQTIIEEQERRAIRFEKDVKLQKAVLKDTKASQMIDLANCIEYHSKRPDEPNEQWTSRGWNSCQIGNEIVGDVRHKLEQAGFTIKYVPAADGTARYAKAWARREAMQDSYYAGWPRPRNNA